MRVVYFLLAFLITACSGDPRTPKQKMRQDTGSAVVRIFGKTSQGHPSGGTGFVVRASSGKTYILTNKHICKLQDTSQRLIVEFPGLKRKYKKRVIEISEEHDLCLVENNLGFKKALIIADKVSTGELSYVVGHPKLYALTVAEGEYIETANISVITSKKDGKPVRIFRKENSSMSIAGVVEHSAFRFSVYSRGGNSGSPIVNNLGQVISVLFAGNRNDVMETYGVPLKNVKRFIEGY